eukprot:TRINITY_DN13881_c0_g1_i2.p1 TRINITY_DN13881_c0_g1~~TRINITY_DN13881_c0_g1_i2.p1  ORF type:complete len:1172 (+),score=216.54 TRINITY_DN13881_c0_g1_i2:345-3860(+)
MLAPFSLVETVLRPWNPEPGPSPDPIASELLSLVASDLRGRFDPTPAPASEGQRADGSGITGYSRRTRGSSLVELAAHGAASANGTGSLLVELAAHGAASANGTGSWPSGWLPAPFSVRPDRWPYLNELAPVPAFRNRFSNAGAAVLGTIKVVVTRPDVFGADVTATIRTALADALVTAAGGRLPRGSVTVRALSLREAVNGDVPTEEHGLPFNLGRLRWQSGAYPGPELRHPFEHFQQSSRRRFELRASRPRVIPSVVRSPLMHHEMSSAPTGFPTPTPTLVWPSSPSQPLASLGGEGRGASGAPKAAPPSQRNRQLLQRLGRMKRMLKRLQKARRGYQKAVRVPPVNVESSTLPQPPPTPPPPLSPSLAPMTPSPSQTSALPMWGRRRKVPPGSFVEVNVNASLEEGVNDSWRPLVSRVGFVDIIYEVAPVRGESPEVVASLLDGQSSTMLTALFGRELAARSFDCGLRVVNSVAAPAVLIDEDIFADLASIVDPTTPWEALAPGRLPWPLMPLPEPEPAPPTEAPSPQPTLVPTPLPSLQPTPFPTEEPTPFPTEEPTHTPTPLPSPVPSPFPTNVPTPESPRPTGIPTPAPSFPPTTEPTLYPTLEPTPLLAKSVLGELALQVPHAENFVNDSAAMRAVTNVVAKAADVDTTAVNVWMRVPLSKAAKAGAYFSHIFGGGSKDAMTKHFVAQADAKLEQVLIKFTIFDANSVNARAAEGALATLQSVGMQMMTSFLREELIKLAPAYQAAHIVKLFAGEEGKKPKFVEAASPPSWEAAIARSQGTAAVIARGTRAPPRAKTSLTTTELRVVTFSAGYSQPEIKNAHFKKRTLVGGFSDGFAEGSNEEKEQPKEELGGGRSQGVLKASQGDRRERVKEGLFGEAALAEEQRVAGATMGGAIGGGVTEQEKTKGQSTEANEEGGSGEDEEGSRSGRQEVDGSGTAAAEDAAVVEPVAGIPGQLAEASQGGGGGEGEEGSGSENQQIDGSETADAEVAAAAEPDVGIPGQLAEASEGGGGGGEEGSGSENQAVDGSGTADAEVLGDAKPPAGIPGTLVLHVSNVTRIATHPRTAAAIASFLTRAMGLATDENDALPTNISLRERPENNTVEMSFDIGGALLTAQQRAAVRQRMANALVEALDTQLAVALQALGVDTEEVPFIAQVIRLTLF